MFTVCISLIASECSRLPFIASGERWVSRINAFINSEGAQHAEASVFRTGHRERKETKKDGGKERG